MDTLDRILILAGTCLPLIGSGLTVILASVFDGVLRWITLFLLPGLTLLAGWLLADFIWQDGNMLAATLFMVYMVAIFIYYPILTISAIIIFRSQNKKTDSGNDDQ